MNIKGALDKAKKLAEEHQPQVDKAIDSARNAIKKHTPNSVDKGVDEAAEKAKDEI
jgi:hypothetical protein